MIRVLLIIAALMGSAGSSIGAEITFQRENVKMLQHYPLAGYLVLRNTQGVEWRVDEVFSVPTGSLRIEIYSPSGHLEEIPGEIRIHVEWGYGASEKRGASGFCVGRERLR